MNVNFAKIFICSIDTVFKTMCKYYKWNVTSFRFNYLYNLQNINYKTESNITSQCFNFHQYTLKFIPNIRHSSPEVGAITRERWS